MVKGLINTLVLGSIVTAIFIVVREVLLKFKYRLPEDEFALVALGIMFFVNTSSATLLYTFWDFFKVKFSYVLALNLLVTFTVPLIYACLKPRKHDWAAIPVSTIPWIYLWILFISSKILGLPDIFFF